MTRSRWLTVGLLALVVSALTPESVLAATPDARREFSEKAGVQRSWLRESTSATTADRNKGAAGRRPISFGAIAAGLVLAALVSGAFFQRWHRRRTVRATRLSRIHVVSATRVGPKAQLVMASVGQRLLLLGVTDSQVTKLEWLDELPDAPAWEDAEAVPKMPGRGVGLEEAASTSAHRTAKAQSPRNTPHGHFLNVLFDAMGNKSNPASDESANAAVELAKQTRDFVSRTMEDPETTRGTDRLASRPGKGTERLLLGRAVRSDPIALAQSSAPESIRVEGQAAGLVARLARSQQ
jgi:flagellar biogenesis protein FliO